MPLYDAANVPDTVGRGTLDPKPEAWLPSGPVLGDDVLSDGGYSRGLAHGGSGWPGSR
jgi:hypothetical protein